MVAHRDPGVPNWLDTLGHERGVMIIRWVMVSNRPQPQITTVPLGGIRASIHPRTRTVSAPERAETIARRADAVSRRMAVPVTTRWSYSTHSVDPSRPE